MSIEGDITMDEQKYAISQYPDVESIYERLDALIKQPFATGQTGKNASSAHLF